MKFTSQGPLFFTQERIGLHGKKFKMYKFRSMYVDAEERLQDLLAENETNQAMFKMKKYREKKRKIHLFLNIKQKRSILDFKYENQEMTMNK